MCVSSYIKNFIHLLLVKKNCVFQMDLNNQHMIYKPMALKLIRVLKDIRILLRIIYTFSVFEIEYSLLQIGNTDKKRVKSNKKSNRKSCLKIWIVKLCHQQIIIMTESYTHIITWLWMMEFFSNPLLMRNSIPKSWESTEKSSCVIFCRKIPQGNVKCVILYICLENYFSLGVYYCLST